MTDHFSSVRFSNYKAFKNFSVSISDFNVLVGPNNAGKSTVIGAFRLLAEGLKKARRFNPTYIDAAIHRGWGYRVDLNEVPISLENVFTNYDDSEPASIEFQTTSGAKLRVVFPESDSCLLIPEAERPVRSRADFVSQFEIKLNFVPVLGPVEHNEQLYQKEAARRALQTHGASRNFRNIWYHYNENFDEFQDLIRQTWRGIEIRAPEMRMIEGVPRLHMFCDEDRVAREIYWAGFGFQVWCQMLTFIAKAEAGSMLVIDEPDIYLHSDLQRQLIHLLKARDGDTLIATHSTEILAQSDPGDLVILDKSARNARRATSSAALRKVFSSLGSNLNPLLTQVGKTRRVVFVEGNDFGVLASFARKIGKNDVANQVAFAVVKADGFRPAKVKDFSEGMEAMLGTAILRAAIFDRDYRCDSSIDDLGKSLEGHVGFLHVHECKELENFVLIVPALERALLERISNREKRGGVTRSYEGDVRRTLDEICEELKSGVYSQYIAKHQEERKLLESKMDQATITKDALEALERAWGSRESRLKIIPGKEVLARMNTRFQEKYGVSLTPTMIISVMRREEIPQDMVALIDGLDVFSRLPHL